MGDNRISYKYRDITDLKKDPNLFGTFHIVLSWLSKSLHIYILT